MISNLIQRISKLRHASFKGGIRPAPHKQRTLVSRIMPMPLPEYLLLSLSGYKDEHLTPVVKEGDQVLKFQIIARHHSRKELLLHAPTSGTIEKIRTNHIQLTCDGQDTEISQQSQQKVKLHSPASLLDCISEAGITGLGGAGFSTAAKLRLAVRAEVEILIINAAECEPYICCDEALLREKAQEVIRGAEYLMLASGARSCLIAIESEKTAAIAAVRKCLGDSPVQLKLLASKYPAGDERVIIKATTGKEVPDKLRPADVGILVQNAGTARAVFEAVSHRQPCISRVVTVVGLPLQTPKNFYALIGTPLSHLFELCGLTGDIEHIILGGSLMGYYAEEEQPAVKKTTNCIIATDSENFPQPMPERACIRCGYCAEACPVGLLPQQLLHFSRSQDEQELRDHGLMNCIECGACAYVCPSNIPLVQHFRCRKEDMHLLERSQEQSQHWQARYQHYQYRHKKLTDANNRKKTRARTADPTDTPNFCRASAKMEIAAAVARVKAKKQGEIY
jgi:electron transport complex protein RnfC